MNSMILIIQNERPINRLTSTQMGKIKLDLNIRERDDLTERQKVIIETMLHKDTRCVMIDGFWWYGKVVY